MYNQTKKIKNYYYLLIYTFTHLHIYLCYDTVVIDLIVLVKPTDILFYLACILSLSWIVLVLLLRDLPCPDKLTLTPLFLDVRLVNRNVVIKTIDIVDIGIVNVCITDTLFPNHIPVIIGVNEEIKVFKF